MTSALALSIAAQCAIAMLLVAMLLVIIRLVRGPNLGDRILALDTLTLLALGLIGALAALTGFALYIDIGIAIALVGFLATVALARYLLTRKEEEKQ